MSEVTLQIKKFLEGVSFEVFLHEPTPTSQEAALVRAKRTGEKVSDILKRGTKAMILRSKGKFYQFVLRADTKINFKKAKKVTGLRSLSLATAEEVMKVTGCAIGGVPPFGNLFDISVYVDVRVTENKKMDFNAGTQTVSIEMSVKDYVEKVKPEIVDFADYS